MIGNKIYKLYSIPQNLVNLLWGIPDINARQKWSVLWPILKKNKGNLTVLDAGCADGDWTLEMGLRQKDWTLTGIDIKEECINNANNRAKKLGISNCNFETADFLTYSPKKTYDLIIAVSSAHYFDHENTQVLFSKYNSWLNKGGKLIMLTPRDLASVPVNPHLEFQEWRDIFTKEQLENYCKEADLSIQRLEGAIGKEAVLAKQIDRVVKHKSTLIKILTYPKLIRLSMKKGKNLNEKSLMWLLIAKKN